MLLWLTTLIAVLTGLPILALLTWLFVPATDIWRHLTDTVLANYLFNSLTLSGAVAIATFIIGSTTAWLCSSCSFAGRKFLRWALILPLAYPPYVLAYTYTGILDYGGSFYIWGRDQFGIMTPAPIRSMGGAIAVITFSLYPYVYLLAYSAWHSKSNLLLEAARTLQPDFRKNFYRIALPLGRPAIVAGIAIVIMETLADYGTVQHFGIHTLSLGIMNTWFGMNSLSGAAQLSAILLLFSAVLIALEKKARNRISYTETPVHNQDTICRLRGAKSLAACITCTVPVLLGFAIPTAHLIFWSYTSAADTNWNEYYTLLKNTLGIALAAALTVLFCSIVLAYARRFYTSAAFHSFIGIVTCGYAVPGVVVAAAVLSLEMFIRDMTGVLIGGGFTMLILAYLVRFLTLGSNTINAALEKISLNFDDYAQISGVPRSSFIRRIHLPMIKPAVLVALLLVFVDVIKELPATLALRPFNFNTFAVKAYEVAADERMHDMALPALSVVIVGLLSLVIFARTLNPEKR